MRWRPVGSSHTSVANSHTNDMSSPSGRSSLVRLPLRLITMTLRSALRGPVAQGVMCPHVEILEFKVREQRVVEREQLGIQGAATGPPLRRQGPDNLFKRQLLMSKRPQRDLPNSLETSVTVGSSDRSNRSATVFTNIPMSGSIPGSRRFERPEPPRVGLRRASTRR